jgi:hypothetical protein
MAYLLLIVGIGGRSKLQSWVITRSAFNNKILIENFDTIYAIGSRFGLVSHCRECSKRFKPSG